MRKVIAIGVLATWVVYAPPLYAQNAVEQFYKGKSISILIGSNAGGGYDAYARLTGRYLSRYIPGHPAVIFSNMSGAGGATVINYVSTVAPRDGTVMAATSGPALLEPLLGATKTVRYDPLKFNYIGSANAEVSTCVIRKDAAVQKFEDVFTTEAIIGSSGGTTHDLPAAMIATLGAKLRLVGGYPGSREVLLAMDKGEVQGICGMGFTSVASQRPDWLKPDSPVRFLAQETLDHEATLDALKVPRAIDYARTPEARAVLEVVYAQLTFTRPFMMAEGAPKDRVEAIRAAFLQALADPELLSEADRLGLVVTAMSGTVLDGRIHAVYATPKSVIDKVKAAIAEP